MCLVSMGMMAQSSLVATLTHEGTTTSFEGINALQDALDRVQNGDIITLSAGTFSTSSSNFTFYNNFTLRGNGMEGPDATIINKNVVLVKHEGEPSGLNVEGVRFAGEVQVQNAYYGIHVIDGALFKSCYFNYVVSPYSNDRGRHFHGTAKNFTFINCKVANAMSFANSSSVSFINCVLAKPIETYASHIDSGDTGKDEVMLTFDHCVYLYGGNPNSMTKGTYRNSILTFSNTKHGEWGDYRYVIIGEPIKLENCIMSGIADYDDATRDQMYSLCQCSNTDYREMTDLFATCTTTDALADDNYELTNEAKTLLSSDGGTERGIHGGYAPFTTKPRYPQFTIFEVAEKAINGKLSVNIAAE